MIQKAVHQFAIQVETVNTSSLEMFISYNTKRVSSLVMNAVETRLQKFGLHGPIDFSVLNLVNFNPGITSSQLCHALSIYPPNMVAIVRCLEVRNFLTKRKHLTDRRAQGLYLTQHGSELHAESQQVVADADADLTGVLTTAERLLLNSLLRRIYVHCPESSGGD